MSKPIVCHKYLIKVIEQVQTTLDDLFCSDCIAQRQYNQMCICRSQVELNYLFFVLDEKQKVCLLFDSFSSNLIILCYQTYKESCTIYSSTHYLL